MVSKEGRLNLKVMGFEKKVRQGASKETTWMSKMAAISLGHLIYKFK